MIPCTTKFTIGTRIQHNMSGETFTVVGNPYDMMKGIYFYDLENDAGNRTLTEPASVVEQSYSVVLPKGNIVMSHGYAGSLQQSTDKFDEESPAIFTPYGYRSCDHDWARYTGFTHSYDYCKKCNEEKSI